MFQDLSYVSALKLSLQLCLTLNFFFFFPALVVVGTLASIRAIQKKKKEKKKVFKEKREGDAWAGIVFTGFLDLVLEVEDQERHPT